MKRMKKAGLIAVALALAVAGSQAPRFLHAGTAVYLGPANEASLQDLAARATSEDPTFSKPAIDQLRREGPAGLNAMLTAYKDQIAIHRGGAYIMAPGAVDKTWPRITAALDAVAAQHDAYASGLYWYTDFPSAQAAAKASGKPILSLRLLGNLSDEYSCANSRFFRTVLYANAQISKYLREHFILHWQSVRPVPVITIDFGDGRIIRRTITGNSIHYVLTANGTVVDAIPGLYGPKAFLRELNEAEKGVAQVDTLTANDRSRILFRWHANQSAAISAAFDGDCSRLSMLPTPRAQLEGLPPAVDSATSPTFGEFGPAGTIRIRRALPIQLGSNWDLYAKEEVPKTYINAVIYKPVPSGGTIEFPGFTPAFISDVSDADVVPTYHYKASPTNEIYVNGNPPPPDPTPMLLWSGISSALDLTPSKFIPTAAELAASAPVVPNALTDADWSRIAAMHSDDAVLDQSSHALMEAKTVDAVTAARRAMSKMYVEDPLVKTIANFQRSIAEDAVRNEYLYHLQIHRWLADPANASLANDVNALNKKVYAELFLTPDSDPWLGLVPADTYTALDGGGVCK